MDLKQPLAATNTAVTIRPLQAEDLDAADRIMRLAFGTFLGLPDPTAFAGDANYVHTRWKADPTSAFAAEVSGDLVGSNMASNWGSVGFFGPLTIRPDLWDRGIGKRLMEPILECFVRWETEHAGLFTFAQSPKHVGLYQSFGFWPRFLTTILSKTVEPKAQGPENGARLSAFSPNDREATLGDCRDLTDEIYEGLDVSWEIRSVAEQGLGETVILRDESRLTGFAICHCGPRTEAGSDTCYIKFGAVRGGPAAKRHFEDLLRACEEMAAKDGLKRIVAGMNLGRDQASRKMFEYGFRSEFQGVAMHRRNEPGYNRSSVYLIDDWR